MLPSFCAHLYLPLIQRCQCGFLPMQEFQCSHRGWLQCPAWYWSMNGSTVAATRLTPVRSSCSFRGLWSGDIEKKQNIPNKQHYGYIWQIFTYPPCCGIFPYKIKYSVWLPSLSWSSPHSFLTSEFIISSFMNLTMVHGPLVAAEYIGCDLNSGASAM